MNKEEQAKEKKKSNLLGTLKVLQFNELGFESMMKLASWPLALLLFIICVSFQSMPTSGPEVAVFLNMVAFYAIKFAVCLFIIFLFIKLLGGKTQLKTFISSTSLTYTYAMAVSMILAYLSLVIFDYLLHISVLSGVVKSFIPYYSSVLFGWCCENVSGIGKKWKSIAIGLIAITLLLTYILFIDPWLCQIGFIEMFGIGHIFCGG